jgi:predicted nucleic acid-binding protein
VSREWIVNASPLITLAKAGRLNLLLRLCPTPIIPPAVAEELRRGPDADPARRWLTIEGAPFVSGPVHVDERVAAWDLGKGESEVLSLALTKPGSEAIMDDLAARNCALALGVSVRGVLGLAILAKREGLIPLASPILDDLARAGMRLDAAVLRSALRLAAEDTT